MESISESSRSSSGRFHRCENLVNIPSWANKKRRNIALHALDIQEFRPFPYILAIVPQAIRAPAFPAGSLFRSSGIAWITRAVPPFVKME